MPDNKKEQEREELHRAIWAIADELRGAVDGWDFKNYVLGTMFYRYISENLTAYINDGEAEAGNTGFDYAKMSDDELRQVMEQTRAVLNNRVNAMGISEATVSIEGTDRLRVEMPGVDN